MSIIDDFCIKQWLKKAKICSFLKGSLKKILVYNKMASFALVNHIFKGKVYSYSSNNTISSIKNIYVIKNDKKIDILNQYLKVWRLKEARFCVFFNIIAPCSILSDVSVISFLIIEYRSLFLYLYIYILIVISLFAQAFFCM